MKYALSLFSLLALSPTLATADNIADCEIVLMETIEDESGRGGAQVASYRPATEFMESIYLDDKTPLLKVDDLNIQAVMCKRFDVIPTKEDFKIVATGIPFFLSQSFESKDTDLVTVFFKDGEFQHVYTGPGLSEETTTLLKERLETFTQGDHDLAERETEKKKLAEKEDVAKETDELSMSEADERQGELTDELQNEKLEKGTNEESEAFETPLLDAPLESDDTAKDMSEALEEDIADDTIEHDLTEETETLLEVEEDSE